MKKVLVALLALMFCLSLFAGCSSSMKDGSYKAEFSSFDDHGWKDFVELTIKDGKITEVNFDSINEEGLLKSEDESYQENMEPVSGTYPEKFFPELENQLLEKQEIKKVDTVTGATNSSDAFKILVTEIMDKGASKGNTDTIIVER